MAYRGARNEGSHSTVPFELDFPTFREELLLVQRLSYTTTL